MKNILIVSFLLLFTSPSFSQQTKQKLLTENDSCALYLINKDTLTYGENRIKIKLKSISSLKFRAISFGASCRKTEVMSEFIVNIPTQSPNLVWIHLYGTSNFGYDKEILRFKLKINRN
jgi:hypothetical protein